MKNFSIYSAARSFVALLALAVAVVSTAEAAKRKEYSIEDLTNFLLGPDYSQWLVGAISQISTDQERAEYLRLTGDEAAAEFVEAFWRRRDDPSRPWPQEQPQGIFERRAREADKLYTESTHRGRRTARGETHILFGPPTEVDYFLEPPPRRDSVEVWTYSKDQPAGLTDESPKAQYFFIKRGTETVRHNPSPRSRRLLQQGGP